MADTYTVERRIHVDAPPSAIHERVTDFHRWTSWSPWEDLDPNLERTYEGPDSGVGAFYAWSGNRKAGAGSMKILEASEHAVTVDLRFDKPFKSVATMSMSYDEAASGGTDVTWSLQGEQTLMLKILGIFTNMDKMVGPDFEKGLAQLKADAEQG